jgi:hypothetical protein
MAEAHRWSDGAEGPAWSTVRFRLDPRDLPQRVHLPTGFVAGTGIAAYRLSRSEVMCCRHLPCGIPMTLKFPIAAYRGIAARTLPGADPDQVVVTLELLHHDPLLSMPLLCAEDLDHVAADWVAWARLFSLPMLVVEADGRVSPVDRVVGAVRTRPVQPRRRRVTTAGRRPRFLLRRKVGRAGPSPLLVQGREICAWG